MEIFTVVQCISLLLCAEATAFEQYNIQPRTIMSSNPGECPSDTEIEEVKNSIQQEVREDVREIAQSKGGDCGGEGWTRIAYLNMSDPSQNCPQGWHLATYSASSGTVRACHRDVLWPQPQCDTVTFPTGNEEYSQVCGRAIGYQIGSTQGFRGTFVRFGSPENETVIAGYYIDGFTLSHGPQESRQHIWSFVAGNSEDDPGSSACPCAPNATDITVPSFVGSNYFCESGRVHDTGRPSGSHLFFDDPLWDGQGCHLEGNTCCTFNSPPYFNTKLPEPTTDDIHASICAIDNLIGTIDDTRINFLEIYIK